MSVLAIDIGGTKFTMALFERAEPERGHPPATARGEQGGARWTMTRRESRATDRTGGPAWMTARIAEIAAVWREESDFDRIGVGFGGPVHFATQKVVSRPMSEAGRASTWSSGCAPISSSPSAWTTTPNTGALGEGLYGAGRGCRPLFYMTLSTGIGGGILTKTASCAGRLLCRRDRPHDHPPGRPGVPVRRIRLLRADCAAWGWNATMGVRPKLCCATRCSSAAT